MKGASVSSDLGVYKKMCYTAIRELLCCYPQFVVNIMIQRAKATTTERELSRLMTEVRRMI